MLTAKELIHYVDFEHPNITYINPKYVEYFKITALRYSRRDPIHYVNFRSKILTAFGNDIALTFNIYEFLSNEYRPSMVVMRFRLCDFFSDHKYDAFKPFYMKYFNASSCPFPKGEYSVANVSIPNLRLLSTFPLQKGRMFVSYVRGDERVLEFYLDVLIKHRFL
ncbi:uncharacterized protein LOC134664122 [Cydia fagiglandana]|uniref:uncharacterized protein LOC134664122 n=1 Tax=Cydia fagiglandana TaxID=1458189 RepID=UPI002FEE3F6B